MPQKDRFLERAAVYAAAHAEYRRDLFARLIGGTGDVATDQHDLDRRNQRARVKRAASRVFSEGAGI